MLYDFCSFFFSIGFSRENIKLHRYAYCVSTRSKCIHFVFIIRYFIFLIEFAKKNTTECHSVTIFTICFLSYKRKFFNYIYTIINIIILLNLHFLFNKYFYPYKNILWTVRIAIFTPLQMTFS